MKPLVTHSGLPVVIDRSDIDTDQIIPKQFLKKIERVGFGAHLFHDMRFLDAAGTQENPDFELNWDRYREASVLISGRNFGSGSSREHAPWALQEYGFRILIASSFADIFYNNAFKNGLLPIQLEEEQVNLLKKLVREHRGEHLTVDIPQQILCFLDHTIHFPLDEFRKLCLVNGWDDIDLTLRHQKKIESYWQAYREKYPYYSLPSQPSKAKL